MTTTSTPTPIRAPIVAVVNVTPAKAKKWLESNTRNRLLRPHKVEFYADQMNRGQWLMAGDPIRFDVDGVLLDGQHRLAAVIAHGRPVQMMVISGLLPESFKVMDIGMNRTPADALGRNIKSGRAKAAASRLLFAVDCGVDPRSPRDISAITRLDIVEYYETNAAQVDAAFLLGNRIYKALTNGNQTAWVAFAVLSSRVNPEWTREFMEPIITGADLHVGDPRLSLRNWLSNARLGVRAGAGAPIHLGIYIKAWNAWMGASTRTLMILRDDESFPTLTATRRERK